MKKYFFLLLCIWAGSHASAQQVPYRVVFDLTSSDTLAHQSLLRMLRGIAEANADAKLEAVLYGQAINLLKKEEQGSSDAVTSLLQNKNITFAVCGAAMKRLNVDKSQLLDGVKVVPDGVYEIMLRQQEGWGYIKVAR